MKSGEDAMEIPEQLREHFPAGEELLSLRDMKFWLPQLPEFGATLPKLLHYRSCLDALGVLVFGVKRETGLAPFFGGLNVYERQDVLPLATGSSALTTGGAAFPSRRRVPQWLDSTVARLTTLLSLPQGWDGCGSAPVQSEAVAAAIEVLLALDRDEPLLPAIVPTQDSGLQLEWHLAGIDLEAELLPHGAVELWYYDEDTGHEREERFERRHEAIRQLDALLAVIEARL